MVDIFISYKREDREFTELLADRLIHEGFSIWWDENINPSEAWDTTIEKKIEEAASVIVLWSPRSIASKWVRSEADFGETRQKLVPVKIDACELPLAYRMTQTIDLCGWTGSDGDRQWRRLLIWLADLRSGAQAADPAGPPPNPFRRTIGQLPSGEPIVEGVFVTEATPPGTVFQDDPDAPIMRVLPQGRFLMGASRGDPDRANVELPQKNVHIAYPFAIGVFPVSGHEFGKFANPSPAASAPAPVRTSLWGKPPAPTPAPARSAPECAVNCISWAEAEAYCRALSDRTAALYRLPSESEWEYACRARSPARYCWGDDIAEADACFGQAAGAGPVAPGAFRPNAFGLHDMHGNVREWTLDLWRECHDLLPLDGSPAIDGHGSMRVTRGGGWSDPAAMLRSSARSRATETLRSDAIGFRVVREMTTGNAG